jgi:ferrochelatase
MKKVAIILFNLGAPNNLEAVEPFLFNLFNDPAIITLPQPIRWLVAKLISKRRASTAKEIYQLIGGKSPLLEETQAQADALEAELRNKECHYKVFCCMRYWHPMAAETTKKVKEFGAEEVILLPLYPQFSASTTASSVRDWERHAKACNLNAKTQLVCCYPYEANFVKTYTELLKQTYLEASKTRLPIRVLFSAHGLPVRNIKQGDPYQWQVEQTTAAIVKESAIDNLDYQICYQSKVGPLEWLKPATDEEVIRAAKDQVALVILPLAFVSEHSETLVELDIEYRHLAAEHGLTHYFRVPTVSTHPLFIKGLGMMCLNSQTQKLEKASNEGRRICQRQWSKCPCEE